MYRQKKIEKFLNINKTGKVIPYKKKSANKNVNYNLLSGRSNISFYFKTKRGGYMTVDSFRAVFNYLRYFIKRYMIVDIYVTLKILPLISLTAKPSEMRMGKGRGEFNSKVFLVKRGQVLCEVSGKSLAENKNFMFFVEKSLKKKLFATLDILYKFW